MRVWSGLVTDSHCPSAVRAQLLGAHSRHTVLKGDTGTDVKCWEMRFYILGEKNDGRKKYKAADYIKHCFTPCRRRISI